MRRLAMVLVVACIAGCTSTSSEADESQQPEEATTSSTAETPPSTSSSVAPPTTTAETVTTAVSETRAFFERRCESRISSGYGAPGSDLPILHVGPVALLGFEPEWQADLSDHYFQPSDDGRYEGIKYVLVVNQSAVGPVTVSIPEPDRDQVRLVYDPARWDARWEEGDHTVKFDVCTELDAQFNGGFIVDAPTCARIVVTDDGDIGSEWSASIPFGVPLHECPVEQ